MSLLGQVTFLALDHEPAERQGATMIDHTQHQADTAASDHAAIHDQKQRLLGKIGEQGFGNGQKPGFGGLPLVLEEAAEASDEAFLVGTVGGGMVGDGRKMGALGANEATDEGDEGVEMAFLMTSGMRAG